MIEVKELVVRADVSERPATAQGAGAETNCADPSSAAGGADNAIIEACVRQVLAILERQKER